VELLDKRGYLTICLSMGGREGRILLRKPEGIREWHRTIKVRTKMLFAPSPPPFMIPFNSSGMRGHLPRTPGFDEVHEGVLVETPIY